MFRRVGSLAIVSRCTVFATRRSCATPNTGAESASSSASKSKYDSIVAELKETESLVVKLSTEGLYSAAASENLRKEMRETKAKAEAEATESFAKDMLEVCDALQIVGKRVDDYLQKNKTCPQSHSSVLAGVKLTEDIALKVLKRYGVSKICTTIGHPFNGTQEEKLYTSPSSAELADGCIADVAKEGYLLNGSILRKAQVAVSEDP